MIPTIPDNAPFSREQRSWLNGYFAGLYSVQEVNPSAVGLAAPEPAQPAASVLVLFGSQTGTAEGLARKTTKALKGENFAPEAKVLNDVEPADLVTVERLLVVTSTYGDGEMPDNADLFWEMLAEDDAPRLEGTAFSVCALGDSSYPDFCQAGKDIDARLEDLGATRLYPRVDCDLNFDDLFEQWLEGILATLCEAAIEPAPALAA